MYVCGTDSYHTCIHTRTHTHICARANRASRCARTVGECTIIPRRSRSCLKKMENGLLRKRKNGCLCRTPPYVDERSRKTFQFFIAEKRRQSSILHPFPSSRDRVRPLLCEVRSHVSCCALNMYKDCTSGSCALCLILFGCQLGMLFTCGYVSFVLV